MNVKKKLLSPSNFFVDIFTRTDVEDSEVTTKLPTQNSAKGWYIINYCQCVFCHKIL